MDIREILQRFEKGELTLEKAVSELKGFEDLGHSRVDWNRAQRTGASEVIFGQGKTSTQIVDISGSLLKRGQGVLVTRVDPQIAEQVLTEIPEFKYEPFARVLTNKTTEPLPAKGKIGIICAGTTDLPVAEEARITAEFYGNTVLTVYDAGVAGLHRLLASLDTIRECRVLVVVAGMEGALPSVVGGLVEAPVIAVPTSVGYGSNFGGLAALLGMLNSCASSISVVNIDNGFGAGFIANRINRL